MGSERWVLSLSTCPAAPAGARLGAGQGKRQVLGLSTCPAAPCPGDAGVAEPMRGLVPVTASSHRGSAEELGPLLSALLQKCPSHPPSALAFHLASMTLPSCAPSGPTKAPGALLGIFTLPRKPPRPRLGTTLSLAPTVHPRLTWFQGLLGSADSAVLSPGPLGCLAELAD